MTKSKSMAEVAALRDLIKTADLSIPLIAAEAGVGTDSVHKAITGTRRGSVVMCEIYGLLKKRILGVPIEV
jgi:hypothetical protein